MQLREIRIHGFGAFANAHVSGLAPGLNVLHGPNEYGKTTLLEFVRRVLFGFPPKTTKANQYPALYSDRYGGELVCQLRDGRTLTIGRVSGKSAAGTLTVAKDGGESLGDAGLASLGHISSDLYHKVYSIGLEELYQIDVLDLDEVKDYVYGAGLGGVRLSILRERFEKRAGELYTKGGHKQRMKELAADIARLNSGIKEERDRLAQYDEKKSRSNALQEKVDALSVRLPEMQASRESLERKQRLFPAWSRMVQAERELAQMGDVPTIPDNALVEVNERLSAIRSLTSQLDDERRQLELKKAAHERVNYNPAIIARASDIGLLSQNVAAYRAAREDLPALESEMAQGRESVRRDLTALGEGWTQEATRSYTMNAEQEDSLAQAAAYLEECKAAVADSRRKLELHKDSVRASRNRPGFSARFRLGGLALAALLGAGCVYSVMGGELVASLIFGAAGIITVIAALALSASASAVRDPGEEALQAEIGERQGTLSEAEDRWRSQLESAGLPSTLSADGKDELLRRLALAAKQLQHVDSLQQRIDKMRHLLLAIEERHAAVVVSLNEPAEGADTASHIEVLSNRLAAALEARGRKTTLEEDILQCSARMRALEGTLERRSMELKSFLADHAAATPEQFRESCALSQRARELEKIRAGNTGAIEAEVGMGEPYDRFVEALSSTTLEDLGLAHAELEQRISDARREHTDAVRLLGELDSELKVLQSADALVAEEAALEESKQQLQDAYREWLVARIALRGIDAAVSRYEEERQPDVIRFAEASFVAMTNGRYERLLKSVESGELHIRETTGAIKTVDQLSRGTREQLYLAMRLGLIEQYEQNAEPLPVVMDDILVNFDDERGPLAVQALAEFARSRQVIVMTCHEGTREMYRKAGGRELIIERGPTPL